MSTLSDWPGWKHWTLLISGSALVSAALYFTEFKPQSEANLATQKRLDALLAENAELSSYRPRLAQLDLEVASLKQRMEAENRIVPDEKQAEGLIKLLDAEALKAGIEIRRYTARSISPKQFYTEVPFELELDGPFYPMLVFFSRVSQMERIVNISELMLATTKRPTEAKAKRTYQYGPRETVVATCTATTFFSHDLVPVVVPANSKAGGKSK